MVKWLRQIAASYITDVIQCDPVSPCAFTLAHTLRMNKKISLQIRLWTHQRHHICWAVFPHYLSVNSKDSRQNSFSLLHIHIIKKHFMCIYKYIYIIKKTILPWLHRMYILITTDIYYHLNILVLFHFTFISQIVPMLTKALCNSISHRRDTYVF